MTLNVLELFNHFRSGQVERETKGAVTTAPDTNGRTFKFSAASLLELMINDEALVTSFLPMSHFFCFS